MKEDELLRKLSDRSTGFVYLRRKMDPTRRRARSRSSKIAGIGTASEPKRVYPQGYHGVAGARAGRHRQHGPVRARVLAERRARAAQDGERRLVKDALGKTVSVVETKRSERRREPPPDARRAHPGAHRGGAGRGRPDLHAAGRHRGGDGPAHGRDPRAGELAARRRQQRRRSARVRATEPRDPGELRAGLDLQGVHGVGRHGGAPGAARHDAVGDARRSRLPTGPWARRTRAAAASRAWRRS